MRRKQFGQIKGRSNTHPQSVVEFLVGTLIEPLHERQGVVNEIVHMAIVVDDLSGKCLQYGRIGQIPHKIVVGQ